MKDQLRFYSNYSHQGKNKNKTSVCLKSLKKQNPYKMKSIQTFLQQFTIFTKWHQISSGHVKEKSVTFQILPESYSRSRISIFVFAAKRKK